MSFFTIVIGLIAFGVWLAMRNKRPALPPAQPVDDEPREPEPEFSKSADDEPESFEPDDEEAEDEDDEDEGDAPSPSIEDRAPEALFREELKEAASDSAPRIHVPRAHGAQPPLAALNARPPLSAREPLDALAPMPAQKPHSTR